MYIETLYKTSQYLVLVILKYCLIMDFLLKGDLNIKKLNALELTNYRNYCFTNWFPWDNRSKMDLSKMRTIKIPREFTSTHETLMKPISMEYH